MLSVGGRVSLLTVLPKLWRSGPPRLRSTSLGTAPGPDVAYEGDVLRVEADAAEIGELAAAVSGGGGIADRLLEVGRPRGPFQPATNPAQDAVAGLLDLMLLFDRAQVEPADLDTPGAVFRHPIVRLLAHRRFLDAVEPLISTARPRYVEKTEILSTPRGRLIDQSVLYSLWAGWPEVACRFDELTYDTDLLRVIRAALQVTAHTSPLPTLSELSKAVRNKSVRLIRQMESVSLLDRRNALRLSTMTTLKPDELHWRGALKHAQAVLADDLPVPSAAELASDAFHLSIPTSKLWESVLAQALARCSRIDTRVSADSVAPGVDVPSPWRPANGAVSASRQPDFVVRLKQSGTVACLDAKYKRRPEGRPGSDDADQLFVYSHLCTLEGHPVEAAALIYPGRPEKASPTHVPLEREHRLDMPLHLIQLPFPSRDEIRSRVGWISYLGRVAGELEAAVDVLAADALSRRDHSQAA